MLTHISPTLAIGAIELVVFGVAILLTVGGWIANGIKKLQAAAEAKRLEERSRMRGERSAMRIDGRGSDDDDEELEEIKPASSMTTKERLDALAARRRAQMASVRSQSGRASTGGASSEPDNLTPAQRAARDRARQAYERRAELLARQREAQQTRAKAQAQAQSQAQQARARQQSQTQANVQNTQQAKATARQQLAASQARAKAAASLASGRAAASSTQSRTALEAAGSRRIHRTGPLEVEVLEGRSTINDESLEIVTAGKPQHTLGADSLKQALSGKSIRAAFVLKEVLDRPVSLRSTEDQPGTLIFE